MRVYCINDLGWVSALDNSPTQGPKFGDTCTVVGRDDFNFYLFAEWDNQYSYCPNYFIPLSDTEERLKEVNLSKSFEKLKTIL